MFNKELEDLKIRMNSALAEIKNNLEGTNSRLMEGEEEISEVEDRVVEITATEKNKEKTNEKYGESLRDIWDNIKSINIHIIGVSKGEKRKGQRKYLKRLQQKTSLTQERKYSFKLKKHRESPTR